MAQLEIKKMKQGMTYSCKEKTIILNVFKYFRLQFPETCVTEVVRRTAKATGCSEKSIFQFRKEEASVEGFKVPSTTKIRRNININSRDIKYDNTVRQSIRNIIYELKYKNIIPSLSTILKQINSDPHLPSFSLMTLRRLLFDMGFSYEKNGSKSILVEKPALPQKKEAKKETTSNKNSKKVNKGQSQIFTNSHVDNSSKSLPHMTQSMPVPDPRSHLMNPQQNHQLLQMHIPQHDPNHMMMPMHLPHHGMPTMLNRLPPPSHPVPGPNMNGPPWMHHPTHSLMKQE